MHTIENETETRNRRISESDLQTLTEYIDKCKVLSTHFLVKFNSVPPEIIFDEISVTRDQEFYQQLTEHFSTTVMQMQLMVEKFEKGL